MTVKIVDLDDVEVFTGQPGEIYFKGPNVFKGYLNNPEGTANSFTKDGYYWTGDIGYVDAEGNFYITDRLKELIKYKGFQVPPAGLEGSCKTILRCMMWL
jgi:4-coumarate--CoA ligase